MGKGIVLSSVDRLYLSMLIHRIFQEPVSYTSCLGRNDPTACTAIANIMRREKQCGPGGGKEGHHA